MSTTTMNQVKSKHFSRMKLFVPRGGKCQFAIKVLNFDGEILIDMLLLLFLFFFFAIADESCSKFYVPDIKNSPLTLGVCDGKSCKCVSGKLEQLMTLLSHFDPVIVKIFYRPL